MPEDKSILSQKSTAAPVDLMRKVPPHNFESEQAVLGGVMLTNNIFHELIDVVEEEDFYSEAHRLIFQAFKEMNEKSIPIDTVSVFEHLQGKENLEKVGGPVYIADLADKTLGAANTLYHAGIVRNKAVQRRLIETSLKIIEASFSAGANVDALLDESETAILGISESRSKQALIDSKTLVDDVYKQLQIRAASDDVVTGVPSGYHDLDRLTSGLQPSDLIIVAGRPSMGKTAFALNMGLRTAVDYDKTVAVFSLEMSQEQLMMRLLCSRGHVDLTKMRSGNLDDAEWSRLHDAANDLSGAPIYIDDTGAITTLEMRSRCRRLKNSHGLDLVIVDYLQLMRPSKRIDSREQEISEISRSLKSLAKELNVPVVALSQLNRKLEDRSEKRPMLSDLRESGAIEQDADVIMFVYRDEVYNKAEDNPLKGKAEIIIGKQRNGPLGTVELTFLKQYTYFADFSGRNEYD
jgi:replicative DNA helicase